MSVINQMLQDLEKRRASVAERKGLPHQVRVLPPQKKSHLAIGLSVLVIASLLGATAWLALDGRVRLPFFDVNPTVSPAPVALPAQSRDSEADGRADSAALADSVEQTSEYAEARAPANERTPEGPASTPGRAASARSALPAPIPTARVIAAERPAAFRPPLPEPPALQAVTAKLPPSVAASPAAASPEVATRALAVRPKAPAEVLAVAPPVSPDTAPHVKPRAAAAGAPQGSKAAPSAEATAGAPEVQIEKRSQPLTAQQLAENEFRSAANLLNQGRAAEAKAKFRTALRHEPGHVAARQALFGLLLEAASHGEAEQLLEEGLRLDRAQSGFAMALARMQVDRGNAAGAIETLHKTAPTARTNPHYLGFLAALLQRQERHAEAVEHFHSALDLAPTSGVWLMGLGISLQALNRNAEAKVAFRRARASNALNAELQAFVDQRLKQLN